MLDEIIGEIYLAYKTGKLTKSSNITGPWCEYSKDMKEYLFFYDENYQLIATLKEVLKEAYKLTLTQPEIDQCFNYVLNTVTDKSLASELDVTQEINRFIESQHKSYHVAIPLHGIKVDRTISLGDVEMIQTADFNWKGVSFDQALIKGKHLNTEDYVMAVIRGKCSKKMLVEHSYNKLFDILAICTFFSEELGGITIDNSYVDISGRYQYGSISYYTMQGGTGLKAIGANSFYDLPVEKDRVNDWMKTPIGSRIMSVLEGENYSRNAQKLLLSLRWYRKAVLSIENEIKFLLLYTALETLFLPDLCRVKDPRKQAKIMWSTLDNLSVFLPKDLQNDYKYLKRIKVPSKDPQKQKDRAGPLQSKRHVIVHNGSEGISSKECYILNSLYIALVKEHQKDNSFWI